MSNALFRRTLAVPPLAAGASFATSLASAFEAFGFASRMDVSAFVAQAEGRGYSIRAHSARTDQLDEND